MSSPGSFFDDLGSGSGDARGRDRPGGRVAWWTIIAVTVLAAAAYVALAWRAADEAPRRASVEGIDIGGQTAAAAADTLRRELGPRLSAPVVLSHRGETVRVVPAEAGLSIDYAASLREAGAEPGWGPMALWAHYTDDRDTAAVIRVDRAAVNRVLDDITDRFDALAVEGTLDFSTGRAVPVYGKPGLRVDRGETISALSDAVFETGERELPVETREPYISGPAVRTALEEFGRPAMSGPVTMLIGPERVVVPPRLVGQALTMIPSSGRLTPLLDGQRLLELLEPRMTTVGAKPRAGAVRVVDGRLVTVPARVGAAWDDAELEQGILAALERPRGQRQFRLQAAVTTPKVTDQTVASWGVRKRLQTVRVRLDGSHESTRVAVQRLHDHRIPAGSTFSLREVVTADGIGPQSRVLASALFAAAHRLGLGDARHTPPRLRDPRLPAGLEVGLGPGDDLRITNTTPHSVLISAQVVDGVLDIGLWSSPHFTVSSRTSGRTRIVEPGTRQGSGPDCTPRAGVEGFTVRVVRELRRPGVDPVRDQLVVTYPARPGVTC